MTLLRLVKPEMGETATLTKAHFRRQWARRRHLEFIRHTWQSSHPLAIGRHTTAICSLIDSAIREFRQGNSSFLVVTVPFRHGKSEIVSRYLPTHFLAEFPDEHVLLATADQELANDFSRFARELTRQPPFQELYPDLQLAAESRAISRWDIAGRQGGFRGRGLGASMVGRGYALGIVDDYHRSRQDAESPAARDRVWRGFTDDFLTRRAPVSITVIAATPWTVDDLIARLERRQKDDPEFPRFQRVSFPAMIRPR